MPRKIKILASGDWTDSGFGTVMRAILPRLARTGLFEITVVGWGYDGRLELAKEALEAGIELVPTATANQGTSKWMADICGYQTCRSVAQSFQPDILFALGDIWQLEAYANDSMFSHIRKVFYVPVDTDTISQPDLPTFRKPEALVVYSQFARDVLDRQIPFLMHQFIPHGIDTTTFKEHADKSIAEFRQSQGYGPDDWVILTVGMNQVRKAHPRSMLAFKAATCKVFNDQNSVVKDDKGDTYEPGAKWCEEKNLMRCDGCRFYDPDPATEKWYLHFHCAASSGLGWHLPEMSHRLGMRGRVKVTKGLSPGKGIPSYYLALLMNAANVHMLLTHREGYGLPITETMACGTPNVVTDYSGCSELIREAGYPVKVKDFNVSNFHQAVDAMADIADAARGLRRLHDEPDYYAEQRTKGLEFAKSQDWDVTLPMWVDLFRRLVTV